jgi:hypothetical protein
LKGLYSFDYQFQSQQSMLLRDPVAQVLQGFDEVQGGLIPKSYESATHLNQLQAPPKL